MSKNQPGTVVKNSSTLGPPAVIEPTPLLCRRNALLFRYRATEVADKSKHDNCVFQGGNACE